MRAQRPIRFLTLNIAHGRGLSSYQGFHGVKGIERNLLRISHLFKREAPDIIALQEVDGAAVRRVLFQRNSTRGKRRPQSRFPSRLY